VAEHEPCIGATSDWFTPPEIFDALGLEFDLDPCSPHAGHWVPARKIYTAADDGLAQPWDGLVFMNPPCGGRWVMRGGYERGRRTITMICHDCKKERGDQL